MMLLEVSKIAVKCSISLRRVTGPLGLWMVVEDYEVETIRTSTPFGKRESSLGEKGGNGEFSGNITIRNTEYYRCYTMLYKCYTKVHKQP